MSRIESGLHQTHAEYAASQLSARPSTDSSTSSAPKGTTNATDSTLVETPFARVNSVVPKSPADEAQLKVGDKIRRVGDVNWINHEKLSQVARVIQRNEGVSVL